VGREGLKRLSFDDRVNLKPSMEQTQKARCVHCRADVVVPDSYSQGDHIKCGSCGTKHKIVRGEVLRIVIADATPLREALQANRAMIERLEADMRRARGSFGLGVNGLGLALIYVLWQVGQKDRLVSVELGIEALGVAIVTGLLLELANYLFLAKRQKISRLSDEIAEAKKESRLLDQKIREAGKV
jgi:DNA-directed RNA polymerase subunit RPC12/RpoP